MGKETSVYFNEGDFRLLGKYKKEYGSRSAVLREALKLFDRFKINQKLKEKYRAERALPEGVEKIQSGAAADLGDYEW